MLTFAILALIALQLKHFIVDFPLQVPYHYLNKGTYGHLGGIVHAALHGVGTFFALAMAACGAMLLNVPYGTSALAMVVLGLIDMVVHYHVDWAKMNLNKKLGYGPTTHEEFWWLLGLDQLLHQLTYLGLIAYVVL